MPKKKPFKTWKSIAELWVKTGQEAAKGALDATIQTLEQLSDHLVEEKKKEEDDS